MTKIEVVLVAQRHHHGGKPVNKRLVKAAAVSKFKKLLDVQQRDNTPTGASPKPNEPRAAKPYGSHDGGTHVGEIMVIELPDHKVSAQQGLAIQNICNTFEGFDSINIKSMKRDHLEKRNALSAKYRDQYGTELPKEVATSFKNEYAKLSFVYWTQQIEIRISSTEPIKDAKRTKDGLYVTVIKTKTVYTLKMMPPAKLEELRRISTGDNTEARMIYTDISRVGGRLTTDHNGNLRFVPTDWDVFDCTDQY